MKSEKGSRAKSSVRYIRRIVVSLVLSALAAALGILIWPPEHISNESLRSVLSPLIALEGIGYDSLLAAQGRRDDKIDPNIVVVGVEDADEKAIGHVWPFPREVQAKAIRNLAADGARVIAYDVLLDTGTTLAADRTLDEALAKANNVVLTARIDRGTASQIEKTFVTPYHNDDQKIDFEAHTRIGFAEVPVEEGRLRAMTPYLTFQDEKVAAFPLAVYMLTHDIPDGQIVRAPDHIEVGHLSIPLTGPTAYDPQDHQAIPSVNIDYPAGAAPFPMPASFSQLVDNTFKKGIFRDKIVFVGLTGYQVAKEFGENYETAYSRFRPENVNGGRVAGVEGTVRTTRVPGVVVQALHYNALVTGGFLYEASTPFVWFVDFSLTFIAIAMVRRHSNLFGLLLVVACGISFFGIAWLRLRYSATHMPWLIPMLAMFASAAGVGWLETGAIKRKWAGYVSPAVLDQILKGDGDLGARAYEATVMFGDIRGFTSFSEAHSPESVVSVLNLHLEKMTRIISAEDGTIDKFLGDGILAVFGAPIPYEDSAVRAVRAAWEMRKAALLPVKDDNGDSHVLATGFGLATGSFLGGDVGSKQLRNWTVIGDVVNLASRLQGVTGQPDVIIDSPTYELVKAHVTVEPLGAVVLKGKAQPVECYKVVALKD